MKPARPFPFHPFLLAIYPILFLVSQNPAETSLADALRPGAVSLAGVGVVFLLLRALLKDATKAATITSIAVIAFFAYGHVYTTVAPKLWLGKLQLGRTLFFLPAWVLLAALLAWAVMRARRPLDGATTFFNAASACLVFLALFGLVKSRQSGAGSTESARWTAYMEERLPGREALPEPGTPSSAPDIYYIILDEYARADALRAYFGHDNGSFLEQLERRGFRVADRSRSNYLSTYLSLASSLNMDYHHGLDAAAGIRTARRANAGPKLLDNAVSRLLQRAGYTFVFFPSIYAGTTHSPHADITPSESPVALTEFDRILIDTSILRVLGAGAKAHRRTVHFYLDELGGIPERPEPTFTFVHFTVPHAPFIFDSTGRVPAGGVRHDRVLPERVFREGFVAQLKYLNQRLVATLDTILAKSEPPPIIIVQGDHGPGFMMPPLMGPDSTLALMRAPILNAYHLPGSRDSALYRSISPVNSFRVVFNEYFGAAYPLLGDSTYEAVADSAAKGGITFSPVGELEVPAAE